MLPTDALATIGPWDFGDTGSANDAIAAWREQNRSAVVEKARRALQSRAIGSVVRVPDIFFPILEESGSTSDELLTDLFARLLTNHLDPSISGRVHRIFARVLGQMSPTD